MDSYFLHGMLRTFIVRGAAVPMLLDIEEYISVLIADISLNEFLSRQAL